jgi:hypothetical protein
MVDVCSRSTVGPDAGLLNVDDISACAGDFAQNLLETARNAPIETILVNVE